MKLHVSIGPNPRVVKMFLAEKGLETPLVTVDLMGGDHGPSVTLPACRAFLDRSEKAAAQWRLETDFARFEASTWPAPLK